MTFPLDTGMTWKAGAGGHPALLLPVMTRKLSSHSADDQFSRGKPTNEYTMITFQGLRHFRHFRSLLSLFVTVLGRRVFRLTSIAVYSDSHESTAGAAAAPRLELSVFSPTDGIDNTSDNHAETLPRFSCAHLN